MSWQVGFPNPGAARALRGPAPVRPLRRQQDIVQWSAAAMGPPRQLVKARRGAPRFLTVDTSSGPLPMRIRAAREDMPLLFERMRASGSRRVDLGAQFQPFLQNPQERELFNLATEWVISAVSRLEEYRRGGYPRLYMPENWDHFQILVDEARDQFRYGNPVMGKNAIDEGVKLFEACGFVLSQLGLGYGNGVYIMLMDIAKRFVPLLDEDTFAMFDFLEAVYTMTSGDLDTIHTLLKCMTQAAENDLYNYADGVYLAQQNFLAWDIMQLI